MPEALTETMKERELLIDYCLKQIEAEMSQLLMNDPEYDTLAGEAVLWQRRRIQAWRERDEQAAD